MVRIARFLIACVLFGCPALVHAQSAWITFTDMTSTFLNYPGAATDDAQKNFALGDLNNDGALDLVIVRKEAFYADNPRPHVLLMNLGGVMTDQTATYAPEFLTNQTMARSAVIADFDSDGWKDVIVVNTNSENFQTFYQTQYYRNVGGSPQSWGGLAIAANRIPIFNPVPRFCSAAAGDPDGDGDLDLFLGDYNNTLEDRMCINNGTGTFTDQTATWFPTGNNSSSFSDRAAFVDADGDGDQDIFESDGTVGQMKIHVNHRIYTPGGAGQVGNFFVTYLVQSSATYVMAVGDLNNDGKPDIYQGRDGQDAYSINTSTTAALSFVTTTLSNSPKTTNFAGNAYIVDLDGDGDNDVAMADTDVDVPGCTRNAVIFRNGTIGPAQSQLLVDPWASPNVYLNIHTLGTMDLAILDLNGDGRLDMIYGNCTGYHVFIQDGPPFNLAVTEPTAGALSMVVNGAAANTTLYTLIALVQVSPAGSGPFFGLDSSAFTNFVNWSPMGQPIIAPANAAGQYQFSLPGGTVPQPFPTQWRTVELTGPGGYTATNIVTITF